MNSFPISGNLYCRIYYFWKIAILNDILLYCSTWNLQTVKGSISCELPVSDIYQNYMNSGIFILGHHLGKVNLTYFAPDPQMGILKKFWSWMCMMLFLLNPSIISTNENCWHSDKDGNILPSLHGG